jgi:hypothetical protein
MPTTRTISLSPSVTYVAMGFLSVHGGARSMACVTRPTFLSCAYQPRFSKLI